MPVWRRHDFAQAVRTKAHETSLHQVVIRQCNLALHLVPICYVAAKRHGRPRFVAQAFADAARGLQKPAAARAGGAQAVDFEAFFLITAALAQGFVKLCKDAMWGAD